MRVFILTIFTFFSLWTGQTGQVDNYYFPVKNFSTEKTYCFVNQNDKAEKSYWKMRTTVSNNDTVLQTSIFDNKNRLTEIMTEKIQNGNSKIQSYTLYNYDKQGNKQSSVCKILDSSVFSARQKVNEEIQWKVNFKDFNSPSICELTKIRIVKSINNNQKTFTDLMRFEILDTKAGYQYHMTSVYQKGKGLISYKLVLPGGVEKDYILTETK